MKPETQDGSKFDKHMIFIIALICLSGLFYARSLFAQEIELVASASAEVSAPADVSTPAEASVDATNTEPDNDFNSICANTTEWFCNAVASFTQQNNADVASLTLETSVEATIEPEPADDSNEILAWFNKGLRAYCAMNQAGIIASETVSVEVTQSAEVQVFYMILDFSKQIIKDSHFDDVKEFFKSAYEAFNTAATLDLPAEVDLRAVKDLNQSFRFTFSSKMMDFQSSCATITPGLLKEEVWSPDYRSLVVVPEKMKLGTEYTITIATATLNAEGFPLSEATVIHFSTFSPEPASITMVTPLDNAVGVATGATIILHFSKDIIWDPDYSPASFSVYNESTMQYVPLCPITAYNKKTLALIPENDLDIESKYSVNILSGIKTYVEEVDEDQPEVASATFYFSTSY